MSRRDQRPRRVEPRGTIGIEPPPRPGTEPSQDASGPSLREQLERASIAARALLPLRFFFGTTFLYAGIDKLLDPAFFDATNPASIFTQLTAFARLSPVAFLVKPMEPFALPIGILIALAEIAIGIGAITGLAFRLAAFGGMVLSLLFWLTASWATKPYYYGPDLPYAFGWATLALAGDGGLLVPRAVRELGRPIEDALDAARAARAGWARRSPADDISPERRQLLQVGVLGAAALAVASLAVPLRLVRGSDDRGPKTAGGGGATDDGSGGSSAVTPSNAPDDSAPPDPTDAAGSPLPTSAPLAGLAVAHISDVDKAGARRFRIPATAPAGLPVGDPAVIIKLADGSYVAFDTTCTHEGCRVGWDAADNVLLCPCHGAAFDPSDHGAVLGGPTNTPLLELPIVVDHATGTIKLQA
ncbi:MAG: Rieske 2Fe-2S domain-containing protein [Candidatus Limnocylindrales bacterium]